MSFYRLINNLHLLRKLSLCLCGVFVTLLSFAQTSSEVKTTLYGIEQGLSQSQVNAICQDDAGFLWIGTQDGLNRFDGNHFRVFKNDIEQENSLSGNYIYSLAHHQNTLWVATENGLNSIDLKTEQVSRKKFNPLFKNSIASNETRTLFIDSKGRVWIGFEKGLVSCFDQSEEVFINFNHLKLSGKITSITEDALGNFWIGSSSGGVLVIDDQFKEKVRFNDQKSIQEIKFEPFTKQIWVVSSNDVKVYNIEENNYTLYVHHTAFGAKSILFKNDGVYLGVDRLGVVKVSISNQRLSMVHATEIGFSIQQMAVSEDNQVWIGTSKGLMHLYHKSKQFEHHYNFIKKSNAQPFKDNTVWAFCKDHKSDLWIGTRNGVTKCDAIQNKYVSWQDISKSKNYKTFKSVLSIYEDSKKNLWLGTVDELIFAKRDQQNNIIETYPVFKWKKQEVSHDNMIYTITETKNEKLLFGTKHGLGVYDLKKDSSVFFSSFSSSEDQPLAKLSYVRAIEQDGDSSIWFATNLGVYKVSDDRFEKITFFGNNLIDFSHQITDLKIDHDTIWISSYGGGLIKMLKDGSLIDRYTEKDGLSNNAIYGILIDENQNLWLTTNNGLSVFDRKKFKIYTKDDGLQSNEFNIGAHFKASDKLFYVGGVNGYNKFNPSQVNSSDQKIKTLINDVFLFNQSIFNHKNITYNDHRFKDTLYLKSAQNNLRFDFAALDYLPNSKKKYAYKLVGFDERWMYSDKPSATYNNLDPKQYIFKVKSALANADFGDEKNFYFEIKPAFTQTLFFKFLLISGLLLLIYFGFRARLLVSENQKQILEKLVRQRTREVLSQKEQIERQKKELEKQKIKSDYLLENILPRQTVEELQVKGFATARSYKTATVMFTDFKGFTKISEQLRPKVLLNRLDRYFKKYDEIIDGHHIEKIKTMGDSYMCVGGIPVRNKTNPFDVILAALEIQKYMKKEESRSKDAEEPVRWQLRIGIHTGELIAGVIGQKRLAYDIWGDTVNIANRMETTCDVGKINISGATYELVKDFFDCTYRGKVEAKNKGLIDMYFVDRIKPNYSADKEGVKPNELFRNKINNMAFGSMVNFKKVERDIIKLLKNKLPSNLHYHSLEHTLDVCAETERIAVSEGLSSEDIVLLKTAALFHDAGFIKQYNNNEQIGVDLAKEQLPLYGYNSAQISKISNLILATSQPSTPTNKYQKIVCDADLDYLGRDDFFEISDLLKKEYLERDMIKTDIEWDELQIKFMTQHRYFTKTSIETRKPKKLENLEIIKERLKVLKEELS